MSDLAQQPNQPLTPGKRQSALYWTGIFATMLLGMVFKVIYDLLTRGQNPNFKSDWLLELVIPVIISPLVFGGIYNMIAVMPKNPTVFIFAFQNGFFWKTIFADINTVQTPE